MIAEWSGDELTAVMNAIADALSPFGIEITCLPLTPSTIVALIEGAR